MLNEVTVFQLEYNELTNTIQLNSNGSKAEVGEIIALAMKNNEEFKNMCIKGLLFSTDKQENNVDTIQENGEITIVS
jgi:hypothetical protein